VAALATVFLHIYLIFATGLNDVPAASLPAGYWLYLAGVSLVCVLGSAALPFWWQPRGLAVPSTGSVIALAGLAILALALVEAWYAGLNGEIIADATRGLAIGLGGALAAFLSNRAAGRPGANQTK
jgi:hypothetical protein